MIIIDQIRSWTVRLSHKIDGHVYIGNGWRRFRIANGLKEGDTFSFELIEKGTKPVMVFRRSKGTSRDKMVHPKKKKRSTKLAAGYFISTPTRYNPKASELYIPKNFAKLNGLSKYRKISIKDPKGRDWLVSLRHRKPGNKIHIIGQGWKDCAVENGLKEGDVIKLGRIGGKTLMMNFSVYGHPEKILKKPFVSDFEAKASCSTAGYPYFVSTVKPYNIKRMGSRLHIPLDFARANGLYKSNREMILRDQRQRTWPVQVRQWGSTHVTIERGWRDFCVANDLKEGDAFRFELIQKGNNPIANFISGVSGRTVWHKKRKTTMQ